MAYRCRCTRCDKRRALRLPPDEYLRPPKCTRCGNRRYYVVPQRGGQVCDCGGYHFKHRRGSKWCKHAVGTIALWEAVVRWGGDWVDHTWDYSPEIMESKISDEPDF
jgi:hypothetical protein